MADFIPPSGPPPPKVPEGWKAVWNDQYKEWFYVNLHTKQSQWDKPTAPASDPNAQNSSELPAYSPGPNAPASAGIDTKSQNLHSNNPYASNVAESDEEMARRLQEEENSRRRSGEKSRGASDSYYSGQSSGYPTSPSYNNSSLQPPQDTRPGMDRGSGSKSGSFLSKIKDKIGAPPRQGGGMGAPMMGYNAGGYPPQRQQYGGYPQQGYGPPQGYGGYPQQGYGGYPQQGYGGYPPQGYGQPMMGQQYKKKGGLGAGGAAALGVGGGLLGGMLLADGIDHMEDNAYDQGYDQGMDDGGDMGDMGGDF